MSAVPADTHARVRQSMAYPRAQGWKRIAYCLFVNNLSEAVLALTHFLVEHRTEMIEDVMHQAQARGHGAEVG